MRHDEATPLDIAKGARLIRVFISGMTEEALLDDFKTQSSVLVPTAGHWRGGQAVIA